MSDGVSSTSPVNHRGRLSLIACDSGRPFASRVADHLDQMAQDNGTGPVLRRSEDIRFANQEVKTVLLDSIRGDDVYVFQCIDDPLSARSVNDNLMALLTAVHAAYQSDPDSITAVLPQFPYSRQERRKAREPITAQLVANAIEQAGARRVITLDIHAQAIEGFFQRAVLEDLHASKAIIDVLRKTVPADHLCVVAPDTGGAHLARFYSKQLQCDLAVADKARDYTRPSTIDSMRLVGEVRGKRVIIPDDMVATGGTLVNACRLVLDKGATEVYAACSHPFFNEDAVERLEKAHQEGLVRMVIGTDAVWRGADFIRAHTWYREASVARLFAQVILNINRRRSVTELLK